MAASTPTSGMRCSMPTPSSTTTTASKAQYRFFVWDFTIGGPVYIPKIFNTQKNKVFFFLSQEYTRQKPGRRSGYMNVPTAAQLAGDFSTYRDSHGTQYLSARPHAPAR